MIEPEEDDLLGTPTEYDRITNHKNYRNLKTISNIHNQYKFVKFCGKGHFGSVSEILNLVTGQKGAIKTTGSLIKYPNSGN